MSRHQAVEVSAEQAWFLADLLRAGSYPWKLAITAPYTDPAAYTDFRERCTAELVEQGIIDDYEVVVPAVAASVRAICQARQWLEWLTVVDEDQVMRGVLVRDGDSGAAVVALRYAQMVTFTPMQLDSSEALVPVVTVGLDDQQPAVFAEFSLPMELGVTLDKKIAAGADIGAVLAQAGVPEPDAQVMEIARSGDHPFVEITAHEQLPEGSRQATDVCVNVINTEIGRILVSPDPDEPRASGVSVFRPAEPFAVAVALRDLTERLPSRAWFPDESFTI
ncbi:secretion protein [Mycolicibacillus koreensis]|nr:secretion protein [Mycolicibacillus koreensis]